MPPPDSHKHAHARADRRSARWIAEGAPYEKHWAFIPPRSGAAAGSADAPKWPRNADRSTSCSRGWNARGSRPRPRPPETLAAPREFRSHRVAADARGARCVRGRGREARRTAYGRRSDRLLASPHFGERQAIEWLDAARYADTHGFNNDRRARCGAGATG